MIIFKKLLQEAGDEIEQGTSNSPTSPEVPDATTPDVEELPEEDINKEEEVPEEIPETETIERDEVRLLVIDKIPINKELKALHETPLKALPFTEIKQILAKYDLELIDEEDGLVFTGLDGSVDIEVAEITSGKLINNSFCVIFWSKIEGTDTFNFNAYLT